VSGRQGGVGAVDVLEVLAVASPIWADDYPLASLPMIAEWIPAFDRVSLGNAVNRRCMLFRTSGDSEGFIGVMCDPQDADVQRWVEARAGEYVAWHLATSDDLSAWFAAQADNASLLAPSSPQTDNPEETVAAGAGSGESLSLSSISQESSPVVRLVNAALHDALRLGASDIHLESTATGLDIRYRIDGVLESVRRVPGVEAAAQVISRLKVLAELDIAETRVPQDGRVAVRLADGPGQTPRRIDLRLSIMPSLHGEDGVLRILDKRQLVRDGQRLDLTGLGFAGADLSALRSLAAEPYGMILASGPTGSGKTTTLYALLSEIHDGREKIVTIEDPVEYELSGVLQIPVNEKKGLSFARGLRSILRHDPDTIMVGEIRDRETAEIAIQSALTGHRVLSTLHANHVFDVFGRFAHMGIDPYLLTSALSGIWAQRLIRTLCPACAEDTDPSARHPDLAQYFRDAPAIPAYKKAVGCRACRGSGYRGRSAILEILALDDVLRTLIAQRAPMTEIRAEARRQGTRSLRQAALDLARLGKTSIEEVLRVTARQ